MQAPKATILSGTFSILAISPDSKLMGVAAASGSFCVGDRVPHFKPGVGVISTQAYTDTIYGTKGLELLTRGFSPQKALNMLLKEDEERNLRQVAMMSFKREKAFFTGVETPECRAGMMGENCIVIGNLLSCEEVVAVIFRQFETSREDLALRMVKALKAGSECGGDKRGEKSAALAIVGTEKVEVEMRINARKNPVDELLRKLKSLK
jgi:uncharacterized Ntn-hydrolase superfamily protein